MREIFCVFDIQKHCKRARIIRKAFKNGKIFSSNPPIKPSRRNFLKFHQKGALFPNFKSTGNCISSLFMEAFNLKITSKLFRKLLTMLWTIKNSLDLHSLLPSSDVFDERKYRSRAHYGSLVFRTRLYSTNFYEKCLK